MTDTHRAASASGRAESGAEAGAESESESEAGFGPEPAAGSEAGAELGAEPAAAAALRRPDVWIPLALLGVFLVLWALVLARPTFLTSFDVWVRDRVQSKAHADTRRWPLIKHVADLGGGVTVPEVPVQVQLPMVMLAVVALFCAAVRRSWRPLAAAAVGFAALGLVLLLKAVGDRPGPSTAGKALTDGLGYFPSGHTGNTMIGYGTSALLLASVFTGRYARRALAVAMTLFAPAMGFSLVWMDYHWLSDVLGSYALCGAALFVVARISGTTMPAVPTAAGTTTAAGTAPRSAGG
jgi:membrane-associated phospholipid phosphatase